MLSLLQSAGNRLLQLDPESASKLERLQGKVIRIDINGFDKSVYLLPNENGFAAETEIDKEVDVTIKGNPVSFAMSAARRNSATEFEKLGLQVSGDIELAQDIAVLFQQLDIDWEEQLSNIVGDFPARKIGNLFRDFSQWRQQAKTDLALNVGEYLQEERRDLATPARVQKFITGVDKLRADADRVAQRVQRLATKLAE